ncbi:MAG: hypothetical protein DMF89_15320 [Acidobacteria bacterium]|nr:MAG: hypothetical protein DMF89_15320 [Acidobacteriota bacterium]
MQTPAAVAVFRERLEAVVALATRTNKATVLVVQQFPVAEDAGVLFPHVRESIATIMGFVELGTADDLSWVLHTADEAFNWVVVDCDQKLPGSAGVVALARARVKREQLLFYSDNQVWFDSGLDIVQRIEGGLTGKTVLLCGVGPLADCFAAALPRIGAAIVRSDDLGSTAAPPPLVLGTSQKRESIGAAIVERLPAGSAVYDVGLGNLSSGAADLARSRGMRLYRLDNRAGISSAIIRLLETDYMVGKLMGHLRLKNVDIVAGGLLAPTGAVIVDDIHSPSLIFGVADGKGRFKEPLDPADEDRVTFVRSLMRTSAAPVS